MHSLLYYFRVDCSIIQYITCLPAKTLMLAFALLSSALAQTTSPPIPLPAVHKIFIEKMEGDLDQYLRAEFVKQGKGRLIVVLDKADADAVLTGSVDEKTGVGHAITGRYLGLEDNTTAAISLVDPTGKQLLWATEAGDRTLLFSVAHRGGGRKVAERVVSQLLKATR